MKPTHLFYLIVSCCAALSGFLKAQDAMQTPATAGGPNLAKQLANPVANLISLPMQYNVDFGIGPSDAARQTLNIQPVIPFDIHDRWNLVTRTILPVIDAESPAPGLPDSSGLGDIVQSFFLAPKEEVGGWIVGLGPVFLWPTATEDRLGTEQWAAGPTAVALRQQGALTYGFLANHLWSYAGEASREEVNTSFANPFVSLVTEAKTTFSLSPEITYDWDKEDLYAPINVGVSQLLTVGGQPLTLGLGARYYFDGPDGAPEWGLRASIAFLFPKS